jgi:hypothetical protein
MAKNKSDWMDEAIAAGHVDADADPDDYTTAQLKDMLGEGDASDESPDEGRNYTPEGSVAETIDDADGIDPGNVGGPSAAVQSTTEETPAEADKSSLPNAMDAKPIDPPVRSALPDIPIAQTLAAGAGEHTPPDPDQFDKEGRPKITADEV